MPSELRELYRSPNGDIWYLGRQSNAGRLFVRHEANQASGGTVTEYELDDFLSRNPGAPEHQELTRLLSTLISRDPDGREV